MTWELIENPSYAGKAPRVLHATCHDRTPFLTVRCACGADMHIHESAILAAPDHAEVAAPCKGCGDLLVFEPGHFQEAFRRLRAEGWIE